MSELEFSRSSIDADAAMIMRMSDGSTFDVWSRRFANSCDLKPKRNVNGDLDSMVKCYCTNVRLITALAQKIRAEHATFTSAHRKKSSPAPTEPENSSRCPLHSFESFFSHLPYVSGLATGQQECLSSADVSYKQLKRDVERDSFILNGSYLSGARLGTEQILIAMGSLVQLFSLEAFGTAVPQSTLISLCQRILRTACRTNSGGATFLKLQESVDTSATLIVPDSKCAAPLQIHISVGNSDVCTKGASETVSQGIICMVQCATSFSLCTGNHEDNSSRTCTDSKIEGFYECVLFYDVSSAARTSDPVSTLKESVTFRLPSQHD